MPDQINATYYGTANIDWTVGISYSGDCWHFGDIDPQGNWKNSCWTTEADKHGCTAIVPLIGGVTWKFTFNCAASEALAGFVQKAGSTLAVVKWATKELVP